MAKKYQKADFTKKQPEYIRVGTDYFKKIIKPDRFGIKRSELKKWTKEAITLDHGGSDGKTKKFLSDIPKYDDFIIAPDNNGVVSSIDNCYNMYTPFTHQPKKGDWKWTALMLEHLFGEQLKIGMIYLKVLFEYPKQALPILTLVSKTRQTGKSTFLDWLNMIFGANMAMIDPDVIGSTFNSEYATSNIIAIDETILDKQIAVEKIKSLATKKFISVNMKNVSQFKLPFFGKIILASNNEDKFMRIDEDEIRFWVRKIGIPKVENHNILNDMIAEIPAFLYELKSMKPIDFTKSRMVLTAEMIQNDTLEAVKLQSRSGLHKELMELFTDYFEEEQRNEFVYARPSDIKSKWFRSDNSVPINYIRQVIKNEMNIEQMTRSTYAQNVCISNKDINGAPFMFYAKTFGINDVMPF